MPGFVAVGVPHCNKFTTTTKSPGRVCCPSEPHRCEQLAPSVRDREPQQHGHNLLSEFNVTANEPDTMPPRPLLCPCTSGLSTKGIESCQWGSS
jgi:hypothetical protein